MSPVRPFLPMVHWDGMDSGDTGMGSGTGWDVQLMCCLYFTAAGWEECTGTWTFNSHKIPQDESEEIPVHSSQPAAVK